MASPTATGRGCGGTLSSANLRRRHHRRRRPRPGDGVLPGEEPRRPQRRGRRQGVRRRRWLRPQHSDPAVELPHSRRRPFLRSLGSAVPEPRRRFELQRDVRTAWPSDPRPQRRLAPHDALAGRGQQAAGSRLRGDLPGGDQAARPVHGHLGRHPLPDPRCPLPPAGWDHPSRRCQLGLCPGG